MREEEDDGDGGVGLEIIMAGWNISSHWKCQFASQLYVRDYLVTWILQKDLNRIRIPGSSSQWDGINMDCFGKVMEYILEA